MNCKTLPTLLLACCGVLAMPAGAQNMKPGLWEMSSKVTSSQGETATAMAEMQKQLGSMPPEQRKAMQDMMQRHGVQLDIGANGALRTKMCMTREMIERKEFAVSEGDCRHKMTPVSGNKLKVAFTCTKPPATGEGEMTVDSDTSYRAHMKMKGTEGNKETMEMDVAGKWLGADCGNIRPVSIPRAK